MVRNNIDQSLIATLAGILMLCGASQCHNPELPVINNGTSVSPLPGLPQEGKLLLKPGDEGDTSDTRTVVGDWDGFDELDIDLLAAVETSTPEKPNGGAAAVRPGSAQLLASSGTPPPGPKSPIDDSGRIHGRSNSLITHALTRPSDIPPMGPETARWLGKGPEEQALERQRSGDVISAAESAAAEGGSKGASAGSGKLAGTADDARVGQSGLESPRGVAELGDAEVVLPIGRDANPAAAVEGAVLADENEDVEGQEGSADEAHATPAPEDVAPADGKAQVTTTGRDANPAATAEGAAANSADAGGEGSGNPDQGPTPAAAVEGAAAGWAAPAANSVGAGEQDRAATVVPAPSAPTPDVAANSGGEGADEVPTPAANPGAAGGQDRAATVVLAPSAPTPDVAANSGAAGGQNGGAEEGSAPPAAPAPPESVEVAESSNFVRAWQRKELPGNMVVRIVGADYTTCLRSDRCGAVGDTVYIRVEMAERAGKDDGYKVKLSDRGPEYAVIPGQSVCFPLKLVQNESGRCYVIKTQTLKRKRGSGRPGQKPIYQPVPNDNGWTEITTPEINFTRAQQS
ncbi:MAG: hypothetical protein ROO73_00335 [Roseivirga sp.]